MWSGGLPGSLEVVGRPSRRSGCGREAFLEVWVWSEGLPGPPLGPPYHFETSGRASLPLRDLLEGLPTTRGYLGGPPDHSRTSGRASRKLLNLWEGFPTIPSPPVRPYNHS